MIRGVRVVVMPNGREVLQVFDVHGWWTPHRKPFTDLPEDEQLELVAEIGDTCDPPSLEHWE